MKIGILSLQGGFKEHAACFRKLGVKTQFVRVGSQLAGCDALVIPGGESTVINKLMLADVAAWISSGKPYLGTCAGAIIFASLRPDLLQLQRNAYGTHSASFIQNVMFLAEVIPGVFIRAPRFISHAGEEIALLAGEAENATVGVRFSQQVVLSFHPELTKSHVVHEYFLELIS